MSRPWLFAPPACWAGDTIALTADEAHHARRVLRLRDGDRVTVTDGLGVMAGCVVLRRDMEAGLVVQIVERSRRPAPRPEIVVYQGAAKGDKLDEVCDRLAQLGVAQLTVYEGGRSVVRWDEAKQARLEQRWSTIARSAAKQSRNPWAMRIGPPRSWEEMVVAIRREPRTLVLWEEARAPLRSELPPRPGEAGAGPGRLALVVGPEGGLEPREAEELAACGGRLVSLGPRILRTEVAPVVATTAVLFHYGAIG